MKNTASILAIILLCSCAGWLASCASEQINSPLPPVTSLKSEPTSASDTNELASGGANAPRPKPLAPSQAVETNPSASAYLAIPVVSASAPMVVNVRPVSKWSAEGLLSLLLWLLAFLVLAAALRHRTSYHRGNGMHSPEAGFARIGLLTNETSPSTELVLAKDAPSAPYIPLDVNHPHPKNHFVHSPKEIIVTAFFNGQEHKMHFSPATTIKKVTAWAIYQFEISEEDHKDAYLTIRGYSAPLIDTAHLGRFVMHDKTKLELDVKTINRVTV